MFIVCEKTYIDRLGKLIDDETNLYDTDNIYRVQEFLKKQNVEVTKRTIYNAIKTKKLIKNRYSIYRLNVK